MCGIAGMAAIGSQGKIPLDILKNMINVLVHRGPDEKGIYIDDDIGIAHARLSIIDLESGVQPIHNEDETLWISYNGEVFNYPQLRLELIKKGHRFYTNTDTEVVLHLYEEKGVDCLADLNGQFALAIWDTKKKELFLARDRMGIRPLYYILHKQTFYFASEIKSLFMVPHLRREFDSIALDQIFTFWSTLPGRTAFKGINELKPGCFMKVSGGGIKPQAYWKIPLVRRDCYTKENPEEIKERIKALLTDAVKIRLRSDVPVGAYLSGGLDSSGISFLIAKNFKNNLNTFGIRFEEAPYDEGTHQKCMVDYLNVKHNELLANNWDISHKFQNALWHIETPVLRTAPVPLYMLAERVRQRGMKVVLTGEGADEVFGGYNIFREALIRQFWARNPSSQCRSKLIDYIYPHILQNPKLKGSLQKFFGRGLQDISNPLYSHLIRWDNTAKIKMFFSEDLKKELDGYNCYEELLGILPADFNQYDCLSKAQYIEMLIFLSNYLLIAQGDRVAMAHSIEMRLPFLDFRIIEYMARVPSRWKILGINEKHILKKVFHGLLPDSILKRTKQPYRAPIHHCFFKKRSPDFVKEMLSQSAIHATGLFNEKKVGLLCQKAESGSRISEIESMAVVGILSAIILANQFINQPPREYGEEKAFNILFDKRTAA